MDPPTVQPIPSQQPKNNVNIFINIFIFLLGILIGLGIPKTTLLSGLRIPYLSATPTPTPFPIPTPTPNPTADWKTYTNNNLGFSFKYPVDYFKFQEESSTGVYLAPSKGQGGNGPKFLEKTDVWLDVNDETPVDLSPETPKNPVIIGGVSGYKIVSNFAVVAGDVRIYDYLAWVSKNNKLYTISLSSWDPNTLKNSEKLFDQILSTFTFIGQSSAASPTPTVPPNWIRHTFNTHGLMMYTPDDWRSSITDFPEDSTSLIKFWKKSSPTIVPIQLDIKSSWDNTGNAQTQPKNFTVDGSIPAYRTDPPAKTQLTQERYQTNVFFEYNGKVYVFECVHNWTQDYLNTCNTMLATLQFTK